MTALATTLQAFFTDRLVRQRQVSPNTLAAYRDTLRLLLVFAAAQTRKEPSKLEFDNLDAPLVGAFLDHLEQQRDNGVRTRNARLAAIRSLFRYAALRHPELAALIERVLAIPPKRFEQKLVTFLTEPEVEALLSAPDRTTRTGRRDHALFGLAAQTGLRTSELIGLRCADVHLGTGAHVSCLGKGRKQRITPLTTGMVTIVRAWLRECGGQPEQPVFTTYTGKSLSRDALEHRLAHYVEIAGANCPTLRQKTVTMHVLRHTAAMRLLHRRYRHAGDRALAWARTDRDNADLFARRPGHQGAGSGQDKSAERNARPISTVRQAARLPGSSIIMPRPTQRSPPWKPTSGRWSA